MVALCCVEYARRPSDSLTYDAASLIREASSPLARRFAVVDILLYSRVLDRVEKEEKEKQKEKSLFRFSFRTQSGSPPVTRTREEGPELAHFEVLGPRHARLARRGTTGSTCR
ncbi:MAG: hypothetical protein ABGY24_11145 [bacterium]